MNKTEEHDIQSQIMIDVSKHDCHIFRTNTGTMEMKRGGYFRAGPPSGFPDLTGFKDSNGKIFFIEVKKRTGRAREDQIQFHYMLTNHNIIHGIARSPEDALKIIDEELVGYGFES